MYNKIVVIGRCVAEPVLRYTTGGHSVCSFTLAVDRSHKDAQGNKTTDFFNVETWRGLAENCSNYLAKGKLALVDGEAQIEKWEKDGIKHQGFKITANTVQFLSPKNGQRATESSLGGELSLDEMSTSGIDDIPF